MYLQLRLSPANVGEEFFPCRFIRLNLPPPIPSGGFRFVRTVLGGFLLVAAGLKAYGLAFDPFSHHSFLSSPRLMVATVEVEVLVGVWLLSGWWPRVARAVALGLFGILAFASL